MISLLPMLFSCGGSGDIIDELKMVPGTYLLHLHVSPGLSSDLTALAVTYFPQAALAVRLLQEGPIGISLVSIDITNMTPQLMLLSRDVDRSLAVEEAALILNVHPDTLDSRIDFVTERGQVRGSVAARDGWTCIYLGSAPSIVIRQWLELEEKSSLAADSALVSVLSDGHDLSILLSGNLISFVTLLPVDRWVSGWDRIDGMIRLVRPTAISLNLTYRDSTDTAAVEVLAARGGGAVSRLALEISDSAITTSDVWPLLGGLLGGTRR
jgi:hypothetical protein